MPTPRPRKATNLSLDPVLLAARGGWDAHAEGHLIAPWLSLVVIIGLIGASVVASLLFPARSGEAEGSEGEPES